VSSLAVEKSSCIRGLTVPSSAIGMTKSVSGSAVPLRGTLKEMCWELLI
jgi:hypothetical protein